MWMITWLHKMAPTSRHGRVITLKSLQVLVKSIRLCKTTKRKENCTSVYLYGESSVNISTQENKYNSGFGEALQ